MSEALTTIESKHAVFVQRFAGHLHKEFEPVLDMLKEKIELAILKGATTEEGIRAQNKTIREIEELQTAIYARYIEQLNKDFFDFTEHEQEFELDALDKAILSQSVELTTPAATQVFAVINSVPMVFEDQKITSLLQPFIKNWSQSQIDRVSNAIRTGFATGLTNQEIARQISGKNGVLDKQVRNSNRAVVRTATNHVSSIAREATMQDNKDIVKGYEWVSTLDSRTSNICKNLDGQVFKWNDKVKLKPPAHPSCRSTTKAVLDDRFDLLKIDGTRASKGATGGKQVNANESYYSWIKKQPRDFVLDTMGATRGKLLLDGGLTEQQFRKLTTDELFAPLTIDEMRQKRSLQTAFEKAGLND